MAREENPGSHVPKPGETGRSRARGRFRDATRMVRCDHRSRPRRVRDSVIHDARRVEYRAVINLAVAGDRDGRIARVAVPGRQRISLRSLRARNRGCSTASRTCTRRSGSARRCSCSRSSARCATVVVCAVARASGTARCRPIRIRLPPELFLVLGEQHTRRNRYRCPNPSWLTIPRRGLHTGVMIFGAVGTGKTSACMYPYVEQILAWRAGSAEQKVGGLILEVKGDFCAAGPDHPASVTDARQDYVEVGLGLVLLLQPAPQQPRTIRAGVLDCDVAEQLCMGAGKNRSGSRRTPTSSSS